MNVFRAPGMRFRTRIMADQKIFLGKCAVFPRAAAAVKRDVGRAFKRREKFREGESGRFRLPEGSIASQILGHEFQSADHVHHLGNGTEGVIHGACRRG